MTDLTLAYLDEIERGDIYAVGHVTFKEIIALARMAVPLRAAIQNAVHEIRDAANIAGLIRSGASFPNSAGTIEDNLTGLAELLEQALRP